MLIFHHNRYVGLYILHSEFAWLEQFRMFFLAVAKREPSKNCPPFKLDQASLGQWLKAPEKPQITDSKTNYQNKYIHYVSVATVMEFLSVSNKLQKICI